MPCNGVDGRLMLTAATELKPHSGRVSLISGTVVAVNTTGVTVNGVTCLLGANHEADHRYAGLDRGS